VTGELPGPWVSEIRVHDVVVHAGGDVSIVATSLGEPMAVDEVGSGPFTGRSLWLRVREQRGLVDVRGSSATWSQVRLFDGGVALSGDQLLELEADGTGRLPNRGDLRFGCAEYGDHGLDDLAARWACEVAWTRSCELSQLPPGGPLRPSLEASLTAACGRLAAPGRCPACL
jgi:hypothetical protein